MEDKIKSGFEQSIDIPEGVKVSIDKGTVSVTGDKGETKRDLISPGITIKSEGNSVRISAVKGSRKEKRIVNTFAAHLSNMFKGVMEGHTYTLKICSGHFPMTVSFNKDVFEVNNFMGESVPRKIRLMPGVDIKIDGNDITVSSREKEKAGQTAASIETLCRVTNKDLRRFQDGIYITNKDGKEIR